MSRVAKNPILVPGGVEVTLGAGVVTVKGPLGTLTQNIGSSVEVVREGDSLQCKAVEGAENGRAMSGTVRALLNNMVTGVSKGFEKKLNLVGVGYRAQAKGKAVGLSLGFSHPVEHELPEGVTAECPSQTEIVLKSADKALLGQVAADIRSYRRPEPYKGKGVRYANEVVRTKEAKKK